MLLGEQERLGIACALTGKRRLSFLDEATASLDLIGGGRNLLMLDESGSSTPIVESHHRSTLSAFHRRGIALVRDGDFHRMREAGLAPAE